MRKVFAIGVCFLLISLNGDCVEDDTKAPAAPVSPQDAKVYRDFLTQQHGRSQKIVNVADSTFVLQPDEGDYTGCMQGFPRSPVSQRPRRFDQDFASANHLRIVDPKEHLLKDPENSMRNRQSVDSAVEDGFSNGILYLSQVIYASDGQKAAPPLRVHLRTAMWLFGDRGPQKAQGCLETCQILLWIRNLLAFRASYP